MLVKRPRTKQRLNRMEYEAKIISQGHKCGMCRRDKTPKERFRLDVDTRTGQTRSLLCSECYTFVHKWCRGDAAIMVRMIQYATDQPLTPLPE